MQTENIKSLTINEVASILRISTVNAYQMARNKEFPVVKIGHIFRVPAEAFYRWLNRNVIEGGGNEMSNLNCRVIPLSGISKVDALQCIIDECMDQINELVHDWCNYLLEKSSSPTQWEQVNTDNQEVIDFLIKFNDLSCKVAAISDVVLEEGLESYFIVEIQNMHQALG